jgi:hypothetical protein
VIESPSGRILQTLPSVGQGAYVWPPVLVSDPVLASDGDVASLPGDPASLPPASAVDASGRPWTRDELARDEPARDELPRDEFAPDVLPDERPEPEAELVALSLPESPPEVPEAGSKLEDEPQASSPIAPAARQAYRQCDRIVNFRSSAREFGNDPPSAAREQGDEFDGRGEKQYPSADRQGRSSRVSYPGPAGRGGPSEHRWTKGPSTFQRAVNLHTGDPERRGVRLAIGSFGRR